MREASVDDLKNHTLLLINSIALNQTKKRNINNKHKPRRYCLMALRYPQTAQNRGYKGLGFTQQGFKNLEEVKTRKVKSIKNVF